MSAGHLPTETRPWGCFYVLLETDDFKVKRIVVNPGGRLSLQSHSFRSEHWTVTAGKATVTVGEAVTILVRGQSVDVPLGARHRIENHGEETVEIVEVQFGAYLGEDDIIRYEDAYNRVATAESAALQV